MDEITRIVTDAWPGEKEFVILSMKDWKKFRAAIRLNTSEDFPLAILVPLVLEDDDG